MACDTKVDLDAWCGLICFPAMETRSSGAGVAGSHLLDERQNAELDFSRRYGNLFNRLPTQASTPTIPSNIVFTVRLPLRYQKSVFDIQGSISLDVLVHEGEPKGSRRVGRCAIPVGSWSGQLEAHTGPRNGGVVADGYFPVLSLDGNKYAGDLRVCLRACLGDGSKLRNVLAVTAKMAAEKTPLGAEAREIIEALGRGKRLPTTGLARSDSTAMAGARRNDDEEQEEEEEEPPETGRRLPARASFDSADLTDGSGSVDPSPAVPVDTATAAGGLPRPGGSAPLSSFQVNEALDNFDASDTLPVWPAPKGSLYHPPETRGEAAPTPVQQKAKTRSGPYARGFGAAVNARRKTAPSSNNITGGSGGGESSPPTRVGAALTGKTRMASMIGGAPPGRKFGRAVAQREVTSSVSPERQAPDPTSPDTKRTPLVGGSAGGSAGGGRDRARAEGLPSPQRPAHPKLPAAAAVVAPASEPLGVGGGGGGYLSKLLDRGKDLQEKMTIAAAASNGHRTPAASSLPLTSTNAASPPAAAAAGALAGLTPQPGLLSGALLDSSLRDDIEGIFDTLSDDADADADTGALVRDPETRDNESRVVDLLLAAAGPPPSSLAFPALAAVERRRADSLARVRFLRIRLSRLVMFGSMTSSTEGHGWQLRFRLPAFATPPGRGSGAAGGRRTAAARAATGAGLAGSASNARVVSVPVPPRVSASTLGKPKASAARRGRSASGTMGTATSVLRVRRGFGACDLVVGETSLLEEVVCAVDVDDACVTQWMDTAVEFLLVDGKTDGAPRPRPKGGQQLRNYHPHLQRRKQSSTVGPGDRVAAVATLPLRDLVLSAELGVAATLDLIEVSDFWAAEDARAAASGRMGRGGRPLRNPYRVGESSAGGARPLVLGDRAIGALAVALELVPGEPDVSPEHSRPEVERWSKGSRQQGVPAGRGETEAGGEEREERPEDRSDGEAASLTSSPRVSVRSGPDMFTGRRGGDAPVPNDATRVDEGGELSGSAKPRESGGQVSRDKMRTSDARPPAHFTAPSSSSLEWGWKDASGTMGADGPVNIDCAIMLRIDNLVLAPSVGLQVDRVRVAYSFTQVRSKTRLFVRAVSNGVKSKTAFAMLAVVPHIKYLMPA